MIETQMYPMRVRCLTGNDNVDHWSEKAIWDAALSNIQIVVCTYQVLYDALSHGFVKMLDIHLLVFDEGQSCLETTPPGQLLVLTSA